jgi:hypothetical protein
MNGTGNTPAVHPKGRSAKAPGRPLCVMTDARCRRCFGRTVCASCFPRGDAGELVALAPDVIVASGTPAGMNSPRPDLMAKSKLCSQFPGGKLASLQRGHFVECTIRASSRLHSSSSRSRSARGCGIIRSPRRRARAASAEFRGRAPSRSCSACTPGRC